MTMMMKTVTWNWMYYKILLKTSPLHLENQVSCCFWFTYSDIAGEKFVGGKNVKNRIQWNLSKSNTPSVQEEILSLIQRWYPLCRDSLFLGFKPMSISSKDNCSSYIELSILYHVCLRERFHYIILFCEYFASNWQLDLFLMRKCIEYRRKFIIFYSTNNLVDDKDDGYQNLRPEQYGNKSPAKQDQQKADEKGFFYCFSSTFFFVSVKIVIAGVIL